jgi:crossover junction endodeoxyribonuclease RuvC
MIVAGVDPGASGAIVVLRDGLVAELHDMPTGKITVGKTARDRISPELLGGMVRSLMPVDVVYIEEVTAMPKQGVSSVFTFGQAHGLVLGAFAALGVRIVRVRPQTWQAAVKSRGDPRVRALELYPGEVFNLKRVKDAGRADALLIAHYGLTLERTNP